MMWFAQYFVLAVFCVILSTVVYVLLRISAQKRYESQYSSAVETLVEYERSRT